MTYHSSIAYEQETLPSLFVHQRGCHRCPWMNTYTISKIYSIAIDVTKNLEEKTNQRRWLLQPEHWLLHQM